MTMTKQEKREKLNWFLFMIGYFTAGYLAINWYSQTRIHFFDPSFAFENSIPFIPFFIFGYLLVYLSVALIYIVIDDTEDWQRGVISFIAATTLAYIFFLALPVKMEMRPEIWQVSGGSISAVITRFYYYIDAPYNLFPSLHVTYPTLATLIAWKNHRTLRWIFMAMAVIVAASVVMVKQHYVADVVAGFANAAICYAFSIHAVRWFRKHKAGKVIAQIETELDGDRTRKCECGC